MIKPILALGALAITATVAMPAHAEEYYIVRGPDRHCWVAESRPSDLTILQIGPLRFGTRDEAERQVRVVCENDDYWNSDADEDAGPPPPPPSAAPPPPAEERYEERTIIERRGERY